MVRPEMRRLTQCGHHERPRKDIETGLKGVEDRFDAPVTLKMIHGQRHVG